MVESSSNTLTLTTPSDTEIVISRVFHAPADLIFTALTTPQHLRRWWGLRCMEMRSCDVELRPGGAYRFVLRMPDGSELGFHGEYLELEPGSRIVQTFVYEPIPEAQAQETLELLPVPGGTRLTVTVKHESREHRDGQLNSGMESGLSESWDRLEELLASQAKAAAAPGTSSK